MNENQNVPRGRPGNLTPEEETKLRYMWQLFLMLGNNASSQNHGQETQTQPPTCSVNEITEKQDVKQQNDKHNPSPSNAVQSISDKLEHEKHGLSKAFKTAIGGTAPAEIQTAFWDLVKHDHPDAILLRWLRARKWDVGQAFVTIVAALHWRRVEMKIEDDILFIGEEAMLEWTRSHDSRKARVGNDFMRQIRSGKTFMRCHDKEGRPVCYAVARLHKPGVESTEGFERFMIYMMEAIRMEVHGPADTVSCLFDLTGFGLANMDFAPLKFMIRCLEVNYPESLGDILVHNAPWVFQGIWRIVKPWLDPVIVGKIHFTNTREDIVKYIDDSQMIRRFGGAVDWNYTYPEPKKGENEKMKDHSTRRTLEKERADLIRQYENVVLQWIEASSPADKHYSSAQLTLTPANVAETSKNTRKELATKFKDNYWKLDPYIRARSLFDREEY